MATSQNGWPASADRRQLGVDQTFSAGGVLIAGGVLAGDVATVLGYVAEQVHRRVERLVAGWCWGHAYRPIRGQTTGLSNHASATAMDLNAPNHPQGRRGTFSAAAVREIRKILAEVDGVVRWGGDWSGASVDEMHFEIAASRARVAAVARQLTTPEPPTVTEDDMGITYLVTTDQSTKALSNDGVERKGRTYCASSNGSDLTVRMVGGGELAALTRAGVKPVTVSGRDFADLLTRALAPAEKE